MTDQEKDARISELEEALKLCNQMLSEAFTRLEQAELRWFDLAEKYIEEIKSRD